MCLTVAFHLSHFEPFLFPPFDLEVPSREIREFLINELQRFLQYSTNVDLMYKAENDDKQLLTCIHKDPIPIDHLYSALTRILPNSDNKTNEQVISPECTTSVIRKSKNKYAQIIGLKNNN